eukprot:1108656-Prorocentrum_minimum.AAC.1
MVLTVQVLPPVWPPSELLEDPPSDIDWIYSYDEAVSLAVTQNKPLFVDFYATWCASWPLRLLCSSTVLCCASLNNWRIISTYEPKDNAHLHENYPKTVRECL